ncbi:MAG: SDR family oxidoreductase [Candidatus Omnitrophica bacterium]|nr:SDR family oxidoreductase [Candidatus Omnitrophota bacterium]
MRALVTGGAGFIGSHLTEKLLAEGLRVVVVDNLETGRLDNLKPFAKNPRFSFIKEDINNTVKIAKYFKSIDWVFHLAALADIVPSVVNPSAYHKANVDGTVAILEAARYAGIKKFVYAASSSCYGIPSAYPTSEEAAISPQYPYALTKYIGESFCLHWAKVYKMPVVSLRLFNVYGPRSRTSGAYGAVFGVFLAQKLHGKPFTVVGDGNQKRDFIYVSDVAQAFLNAASSDVCNEIFNVGSGNPQSINALVALLEGEVIHIPKRPGEPDCTWADIEKIKKTLRWQPRISFEEGVRRMLANIDYWKQAPVWTRAGIKSATKEWFKYISI